MMASDYLVEEQEKQYPVTYSQQDTQEDIEYQEQVDENIDSHQLGEGGIV